MSSLPNSVVCLLNNSLNKEQYDENNLIPCSDLPAEINFRYNTDDYVDPSCAISRFLQGPKKLAVECTIRYDDPVTGRMRYKFYKMNSQGNWIEKF